MSYRQEPRGLYYGHHTTTIDNEDTTVEDTLRPQTGVCVCENHALVRSMHSQVMLKASVESVMTCWMNSCAHLGERQGL